MAKPKPRLQCNCKFCGGNFVSSSTWYRHNPGGRKKQYRLPQEVMDATLTLPDTDTFPQAKKRRFDEEDGESVGMSKRAAGSSSVRMALQYPHVCAPNKRFVLPPSRSQRSVPGLVHYISRLYASLTIFRSIYCIRILITCAQISPYSRTSLQGTFSCDSSHFDDPCTQGVHSWDRSVTFLDSYPPQNDLATFGDEAPPAPGDSSPGTS